MSLSKQRVYGEHLLTHLSQSNIEIAVPIQECIHMLLRTGMREEVGPMTGSSSLHLHAKLLPHLLCWDPRRVCFVWLQPLQ